MYDKPTEKKKTKLTGFQLAGAVLAALLLVVGGALMKLSALEEQNWQEN